MISKNACPLTGKGETASTAGWNGVGKLMSLKSTRGPEMLDVGETPSNGRLSVEENTCCCV